MIWNVLCKFVKTRSIEKYTTMVKCVRVGNLLNSDNLTRKTPNAKLNSYIFSQLGILEVFNSSIAVEHHCICQ